MHLTANACSDPPGMTSIRVDKKKTGFWALSRKASEPGLFRGNENDSLFQNLGDACFTSNMPIIAGQYSITHKRGIYFEITIREMSGDGSIALGACSYYLAFFVCLTFRPR
jgi:hypothetical protein